MRGEMEAPRLESGWDACMSVLGAQLITGLLHGALFTMSTTSLVMGCYGACYHGHSAQPRRHVHCTRQHSIRLDNLGWKQLCASKVRLGVHLLERETRYLTHRPGEDAMHHASRQRRNRRIQKTQVNGEAKCAFYAVVVRAIFTPLPVSAV